MQELMKQVNQNGNTENKTEKEEIIEISEDYTDNIANNSLNISLKNR